MRNPRRQNQLILHPLAAAGVAEARHPFQDRGPVRHQLFNQPVQNFGMFQLFCRCALDPAQLIK